VLIDAHQHLCITPGRVLIGVRQVEALPQAAKASVLTSMCRPASDIVPCAHHADKLSPFKFYQYFLTSVTDGEVVRFLRMLTFLPLEVSRAHVCLRLYTAWSRDADTQAVLYMCRCLRAVYLCAPGVRSGHSAAVFVLAWRHMRPGSHVPP